MKNKVANTADVSRKHEDCEELIGVLTAISIVAKRLAKRLTAIERQIESKYEKRGSEDGI